MSWPLWILVAVLGAGLFGLGCIFARTLILARMQRGDGGSEGMLDNRGANLILAVMFTVLAIGIGADTIYTQVRFHRFTHAQVDCNTSLIDTEVKISKQRRIVDEAAADYDLAMNLWLTRIRASTEIGATPIGLDDIAYVDVQSKLRKLTDARLAMLQTYADNPFIGC